MNSPQAIYAMESEEYTLGNAYFNILAMLQKLDLLHDNDAMYPYEDEIKVLLQHSY
jgi:hypothetical protein